MQRQCLKRFIGLQLVIAIALVAAIVLAYYLQKSNRTGPTESSSFKNTSVPFYDGKKYTVADTDSSVPAADVLYEQTDDGSSTSPNGDDFIATIELPQLPLDLGITPRFDNGQDKSSDEDGFSNSMAYDWGRSKRERQREKRKKRRKASQAPAATRGSDDTLSDPPSPMPGNLPSAGQSLETSLPQSDDESPTDSITSDALVTDIVTSSQDTSNPTESTPDSLVSDESVADVVTSSQATSSPTESPTGSPVFNPTSSPTESPTDSPTFNPTSSPTKSPTDSPTSSPTSSPTIIPSESPSGSYFPSIAPTSAPSKSAIPTASPTTIPSESPTAGPTETPTRSPTESPTDSPTISPTSSPTESPSESPSGSYFPSIAPTSAPSKSVVPSVSPTATPTKSPTGGPTKTPTFSPTETPTSTPTSQPSPKPSPELTSSPTSGPTAKPTHSFDVLIANFVDGLSGESAELSEATVSNEPADSSEVVVSNEAAVASDDMTCPPTHDYSTECSDAMIGRECFYDYAYTGCNWRTLECSPMVECKCESVTGLNQATWSCKENLLLSCRLRRRANLPEVGQACIPDEGVVTGVFRPPIEISIGEAGFSTESPSTAPTEIPTAMVVETEFPDEILSNNLTEVVDLSSECPLSPEYGECSGYQEGLQCSFDYIYKGCRWEELECSPAIECECSEEFWDCEVDFTRPCDITINGHPPGGIPWGEECDPSEPIVIPPKKTDCPISFAIGSCIEYEDNLKCEYNHAYKGCSWDDFECAPTVTCDCERNFWKCYGDFEEICDLIDTNSSIPEGLPWGDACDPIDDTELQEYLRNRSEPPTTAPSSTPTSAQSELVIVNSQLELSDKCPTTFQHGECMKTYVDELVCPYNYAYTGCTWEELSCEASIQCKCDYWLGFWQCKSNFQNCFEEGSSEVLPVGLPWGESCDPATDLPQPPP